MAEPPEQMTADRPELQTRDGSPSGPDRQGGPSGVAFILATVGMFLFVAVVFVLLGVGGWGAFAGAIVVMVVGVIALSRYIQWISWTGGPPPRAGEAVSEQPSVSEEEMGEITARDLPLDNPARAELLHREASAAAAPAGGGHAAPAPGSMGARADAESAQRSAL